MAEPRKFTQTFTDLQAVIDNIQYLREASSYDASHLNPWIKNLKDQIDFDSGAVGFNHGQFWKANVLSPASTTSGIPGILGITNISGQATTTYITLANLASVLSNTGANSASLARTDTMPTFNAGIEMATNQKIKMGAITAEGENPFIQFGVDASTSPVYYVQGYLDELLVGGSVNANKATKFHSDGSVTFPQAVTITGNGLINGTCTITGALTANSLATFNNGLTVSGNSTFNNNLTVSGVLNLAATTGSNSNIGSNGIRWNAVSLPEVAVNGTIDSICIVDSVTNGGRQKRITKANFLDNLGLATKEWCNNNFGTATINAINGMFNYNNGILTITPIRA